MHLRKAAYLALLLLPLAACSDWFVAKHPRHHPIKQAKTHYTADDYLTHLALTRLDAEPDAADLDVLEGYMAQKPQKTRRQTVIILTYQQDGVSTRSEIAAPVAPAAGKDFPSLLAVMQKLDAMPHTLHNLHMATTAIVPTDGFRAPDVETQQLTLDQQQQWILSNAERLPPLDDAEAELRLATFFTRHGFRDAAYLAVDNAKRLLGAASQQKADKERLRALSDELDTVEEKLHKTLPFTL